jgi:hypothetical protein
MLTALTSIIALPELSTSAYHLSWIATVKDAIGKRQNTVVACYRLEQCMLPVGAMHADFN